MAAWRSPRRKDHNVASRRFSSNGQLGDDASALGTWAPRAGQWPPPGRPSSGSSSNWTVPPFGLTKPETVRRRVVLPAPLAAEHRGDGARRRIEGNRAKSVHCPEGHAQVPDFKHPGLPTCRRDTSPHGPHRPNTRWPLRGRSDHRRGAFGDHLAEVEHDETVAHRHHQIHVVLDQQDRHAAGEAPDGATSSAISSLDNPLAGSSSNRSRLGDGASRRCASHARDGAWKLPGIGGGTGSSRIELASSAARLSARSPDPRTPNRIAVGWLRPRHRASRGQSPAELNPLQRRAIPRVDEAIDGGEHPPVVASDPERLGQTHR